MGKRGFDLAALARASMGVSGPENAVSNLDTVQEIDAGRIMANEANFYEMTELEELAASIELVGLLHPVLVMPDGGDGGYILIDGERRVRAMTDVLHRKTVPCIVRRPANDVIEELMLIEANRTQRKISAAELSRQAERYTELLAALRDSGAEIPGRLRDRVAEALDVSSSKLARLSAIRQKLRPALLKKFDDGKLSESVAYEYSKMDRMGQADAWSAGLITAEDVRRFAARRKEAAGQVARGSTSFPQKAVQTGLPSSGEAFDPEAYLRERQDEDDAYFFRLSTVADSFLPELSAVNSRREGIEHLKEIFGKTYTGHWGPDEFCWDAEPKGLSIGGILRTWTEVYDMLCTIALNRAVSSGLERYDRPENTAEDAVSELDTGFGPEASRARTVFDNDPARDASGAVEEDMEESVFNLDTGAFLAHWHRTAPDCMPPEIAPYGSAILLWGDGGLSRTPDSLVKMTVTAMPESARWWAVVRGPEEDEDETDPI